MSSSMKGLLKGLRYIARIFEDEKEPEMQIGNPTDVKHVAHIGWEGPSATTPSWMNEFRAPELMSEPFEPKGSSNKKPTSSSNQSEKQKHKGRRKSSTGTSSSPVDSPTKLGSAKQSRRSTGKQQQQSTGPGSGSGSGLELPSQTEQSMMPKQSKQRKSKGSAGGGESAPVRAARTKEGDCPVAGVCPFTGLGTSKGR